jgi:hypothetical protein
VLAQEANQFAENEIVARMSASYMRVFLRVAPGIAAFTRATLVASIQISLLAIEAGLRASHRGSNKAGLDLIHRNC